MAHNLHTLQPLWSFASEGRPCARAPYLIGEPEARPHAVQSWTVDADGRPRARWVVGQHRFLDA